MAEVGAPVGTGGTVICCSGGGIRSAAFSLGGLQALDEVGLYHSAKAVVGVSGGGYIGAAYHVLRWNPADAPIPHGSDADQELPEWDSLPGGQKPFAADSPETQWLRRHTRYVMNSARVAVHAGLSLAFGIAVNVLVIAAVLGGTAWILCWLMLASGRLTSWGDSDFTDLLTLAATGRLELSTGEGFAAEWSLLGAVWLVPLLGAVLFLGGKVWDRWFDTMTSGLRSATQAAASWLLLGGAALTGLMLGVPWLLAELGHYSATSESAPAGLLYQVGLVPKDVCKTALQTCECLRSLRTTDPAAAASVATVSGVSFASIVGSILAVLASVKAAGKESSGTRKFFSKFWARVRDPIVPWTAVVVVLLVFGIVLLRWIAALVEQPNLLSQWFYAYLFGSLLVAVKLATDANRTSMHHFFRERISYAFFVRRRPNVVEPVPYERPLRFSEALPVDGGPQLVACAVANVSDEEIVPSKRNCTPFVFDNEKIGLTDGLLPRGAAQRASATYEFAADPRFRDATIPAAAAMSAAAFSPLAGRETWAGSLPGCPRARERASRCVASEPYVGRRDPAYSEALAAGTVGRRGPIAVALPRDGAWRPTDPRLSDQKWSRLKALDDARQTLESARFEQSSTARSMMPHKHRPQGRSWRPWRISTWQCPIAHPVGVVGDRLGDRSERCQKAQNHTPCQRGRR